MKEVPAIVADPPPRLRLRRYVPEGIEYEVKLWTADLAHLPEVRSDALIQIWYRFRRAGVEIPYPIQEWRRGPRVVREHPPEESAATARAHLGSLPFFSSLPEDVLAALARGAELLDYGAGEQVVGETPAT
jgi:small-conductance mechanosensitive channel